MTQNPRADVELSLLEEGREKFQPIASEPPQLKLVDDNTGEDAIGVPPLTFQGIATSNRSYHRILGALAEMYQGSNENPLPLTRIELEEGLKELGYKRIVAHPRNESYGPNGDVTYILEPLGPLDSPMTTEIQLLRELAEHYGLEEREYEEIELGGALEEERPNLEVTENDRVDPNELRRDEGENLEMIMGSVAVEEEARGRIITGAAYTGTVVLGLPLAYAAMRLTQTLVEYLQ